MKRLSFLVMEDDPQDCRQVAEFIQNLGHDAMLVPTVPGAMRVLEEQRFDGVLVDHWIEDRSGERILEWLRERGREEPVIVMSAQADYDLMIELINKGAVDLIAKPIQPAQLRRSIELAVTQRALAS